MVDEKAWSRVDRSAVVTVANWVDEMAWMMAER